jgi:hypothetical protein
MSATDRGRDANQQPDHDLQGRKEGEEGEKEEKEGQPDLRDSLVLRSEENRADQAVPHSPIPQKYKPLRDSHSPFRERTKLPLMMARPSPSLKIAMRLPGIQRENPLF